MSVKLIKILCIALLFIMIFFVGQKHFDESSLSSGDAIENGPVGQNVKEADTSLTDVHPGDYQQTIGAIHEENTDQASDNKTGSQDIQEDRDNTGSDFLILALIILSLTSLISTVISFWLYRWRRILLGNIKGLAPEEFAELVNVLNDAINKHKDEVTSGVNKINERIGKVEDMTQKMNHTFMTLQKAIEEKDQEIARYKAGYDSKVFKQFINRFLRVDQAIEDYLLEVNKDLKTPLEDVRSVLEDALDDCGVEKFAPEKDAPYKNTEGVADRPKLQETDVPEKNGLIAEVIEHGYRLRNGESHEIIVPAKVSVYILRKKGE